MVGRAKQPTKEEQRRIDDMLDVGCICCRRSIGMYRPAEVHHIVQGHKRLGHWYTLPLCEWHHRGVPMDGADIEYMRRSLGPSLAHHKKQFIDRYGTELDLHEVVNAIINRRVW